MKCYVYEMFMLFCLISLHYVNGINKVMMMMMKWPGALHCHVN